jgi:5-methylcytosine-specific restriction endonuclease McrA
MSDVVSVWKHCESVMETRLAWRGRDFVTIRRRWPTVPGPKSAVLEGSVENRRIGEIKAVLKSRGWWGIAIAAVQAYGYHCAFCGADVSNYDMHDWPLDHLRPKSLFHKKGGSRWTEKCNAPCPCNALDNLVIACRVCNDLKGRFDPAKVAKDGSRASLLKAAEEYVRPRRAARDEKNARNRDLVKELYTLGQGEALPAEREELR